MQKAIAVFIEQLYLPRTQIIMRILFIITLLIISNHAFADDTGDMLKGTDQSFWATLNGTGKKYIYGIELITGLATFMKTRNYLIFTGVVAISLFINAVLKMAGAPSS